MIISIMKNIFSNLRPTKIFTIIKVTVNIVSYNFFLKHLWNLFSLNSYENQIKLNRFFYYYYLYLSVIHFSKIHFVYELLQRKIVCQKSYLRELRNFYYTESYEKQ